MAVFALTFEYVSINAVDYSAYIKGATLTYEADELDSTGMTSSGTKTFIGGLKAGTLTIEAMDDAATGALSQAWFALLGTVTAFEVRATGSAVGVNNPKYTGSVLVSKWGFGGKVGDIAMKSVTWPVSGAVTQATA